MGISKHSSTWRRTLKGGFVALALAIGGTAHAAWPEKPIRMIVPFPAGGINDVVGRLAAENLGKELGANIVVENRAGAGGTIGSTAAANSAPDGYTILLGASSTIAVAPNLYKELAYNPLKNFVAVGGIGSTPSVAVVASDGKWNSFEEIVKADKDKPGSINYGSAGPGTSHHIKTELVKLRSGTQWVHIPYKGGAPAMTDLIGGQIDFLIEPLPTALTNVNGGRVKALAVTTAERSPAMPDVKTFKEMGIADIDATLWFGVFAPAGTDPAIVSKMGDALHKVMTSDAVRKDFESRGLSVYAGSADDFRKFVASEIQLWGDVIKQANITVQ